MSERKFKKVGIISHYFTNIAVAIVELNDDASVGDRILIQGATTNFEQTIDSMQIEHTNVIEAHKGQSIGLKVIQRVREQDEIFKIT
jgi:putative protease